MFYLSHDVLASNKHSATPYRIYYEIRRRSLKKKKVPTPQHAPIADSDKRRLRIQLRLWKPGLSKLPTEEDYIELTGWYEAWLDGASFGDDWQQYRVQYLGWQLDWQSKPLPPDWYMKSAYALGI